MQAKIHAMNQVKRRNIHTADTSDYQKKIINEIPQELYQRVIKSKKSGYDFLRKDNLKYKSLSSLHMLTNRKNELLMKTKETFD